jgi:hypothetical protein
MKVAEIKVGRDYSNGKQRETVREVLEIRFNWDYNDTYECVLYLGRKGKFKGVKGWILVKSFATWAHHAVEVIEPGEVKP